MSINNSCTAKIYIETMIGNYRSMTDAAAIYSHMVHSLGDRAWLSEDRRADKSLVDLYHGSILAEDQTRIIAEFPKPCSVIRCVVATIAFGMGIDVADVKYIFHWGPSPSMLEYWQQVGRCSRNGENGECFLFVSPRSLDSRRAESQTIQLCKLKERLRIGILQHLVIPMMDVSGLQHLRSRELCHNGCSKCACDLCLCCSLCHATCPCNNEVNEKALSEISI